jgi:SH3-like domain-containing protein
MRTQLAIGVLAAALATGRAVAAEVTVVVAGDRVNMRARPSLQAEVVGQLNEGDKIVVRSLTNDWAEVTPPAGIEFCVHRDFVKDGAVSVPRLHVRAGPGINFSKVGQMVKGDAVKVTGEFGEWLKIAPPPGTSLWVARSMVKLPEPRTAAPTKLPVAATSTVAVVAPPRPVAVPPSIPAVARPVTPPSVAPPPATPPAAPAVAAPYTPDDLRLAPVDNQGSAVMREGRVRATVLVLGRPSRYHLVDESAGGSETICYLRGNEAQIRSFVDRKLRIRGRQYWVQGSRHPVVVIDQIAPMAE